METNALNCVASAFLLEMQILRASKFMLASSPVRTPEAPSARLPRPPSTQKNAFCQDSIDEETCA